MESTRQDQIFAVCLALQQDKVQGFLTQSQTRKQNRKKKIIKAEKRKAKLRGDIIKVVRCSVGEDISFKKKGFFFRGMIALQGFTMTTVNFAAEFELQFHRNKNPHSLY